MATNSNYPEGWYKAWNEATKDMVRAGIPEKIAMQISGHEAHSVLIVTTS